jgi:peroxin-1
LEAVARKLHIDPSVDLAEVARECEGYTGADLQALLYNAHLDAAHELIDGTATNNTSSNQVDADELDFLTFNVANLTAAERGQLSRRVSHFPSNSIHIYLSSMFTVGTDTCCTDIKTTH